MLDEKGSCGKLTDFISLLQIYFIMKFNYFSLARFKPNRFKF